MEPDAARLSTVPLFEGVPGDDLAVLAQAFDVETFSAGTALVREGRVNYEFFVVDEGTVRVEHEGRTIATLGPGDVYGEMALLGDGHRAADAIAHTDVRVFAMFGTEFREMQTTLPDVARRLGELADRRRAALER